MLVRRDGLRWWVGGAGRERKDRQVRMGVFFFCRVRRQVIMFFIVIFSVSLNLNSLPSSDLKFYRFYVF